jgi:hypothetical protein
MPFLSFGTNIVVLGRYQDFSSVAGLLEEESESRYDWMGWLDGWRGET